MCETFDPSSGSHFCLLRLRHAVLIPIDPHCDLYFTSHCGVSCLPRTLGPPSDYPPGTAGGLLSTPGRLSSTPGGLSCIPSGLHSTLGGLLSTPDGLYSTPCGIPCTQCGLSSTPDCHFWPFQWNTKNPVERSTMLSERSTSARCLIGSIDGRSARVLNHSLVGISSVQF